MKKKKTHRPVDVIDQVRQPRQRPEQGRPRRRGPDGEEPALAERHGVPEPPEPERDVVLELAERRRRRVDEPEEEQHDRRELLGRRRGERLRGQRRRRVPVPEEARPHRRGEVLLVGLVLQRARVLAVGRRRC